MQSPALLHSMRPARRGISEARSPRHQRSRQKRLSRGNLVQIYCLLLFIFSAVGVHAAERRVGAAGAAEGIGTPRDNGGTRVTATHVPCVVIGVPTSRPPAPRAARRRSFSLVMLNYLILHNTLSGNPTRTRTSRSWRTPPYRTVDHISRAIRRVGRRPCPRSRYRPGES